MVSHPENGSDSPIGSNRDRGRDRTIVISAGFSSKLLASTAGCLIAEYSS